VELSTRVTDSSKVGVHKLTTPATVCFQF